MRYISVLFVLLGCVANPKGPISGKKVAITVEGLGSNPFVSSAFTKTLKEKGYEVYSLNWKYKGAIKGDKCIGLSFGADRLMQEDVLCGTVFTMDARSWKASNNSKYVSQHKEHYNFYQKGPFEGHPIENAVNKKMNCRHTAMPKCAYKYIVDKL